MSTTGQTLSALRTLGYSAAKLADIITDGIADAEVRAQVREACLRELRWVDDLVGGESADGLRLTDAERGAIEFALARFEWPLDGPQLEVVARTLGQHCAVPEDRMKAALRGLLERTK